MKILLVIIFLASYHLCCGEDSRNRLMPHCRWEVDTSEMLPLWYGDEVQDTILHRLRFGYGAHDEAPIKSNTLDSCVIYFFREPPSNPKLRSDEYISHSETIDILAWLVRRIPSSSTCSGNGDIIIYNALAIVSYVDSSNNLAWGVMLLTKDRFLEEIESWKLAWSGGDVPLVRYDKKPTNGQLYDFLKGMQAVENQLFPFNTDGSYDHNGVHVQFIDGDVREKTWESVIGEKPTKFFPNGR